MILFLCVVNDVLYMMRINYKIYFAWYIKYLVRSEDGFDSSADSP